MAVRAPFFSMIMIDWMDGRLSLAWMDGKGEEERTDLAPRRPKNE